MVSQETHGISGSSKLSAMIDDRSMIGHLNVSNLACFLDALRKRWRKPCMHTGQGFVCKIVYSCGRTAQHDGGK